MGTKLGQGRLNRWKQRDKYYDFRGVPKWADFFGPRLWPENWWYKHKS